MVIYLDMCCLKRPFDDQSQPRIRLESEAVLALLAMESGEIKFVRSPGLMLENSCNPVKERALRVERWLSTEFQTVSDFKAIEQRIIELNNMGFKPFDALHLASAEQLGADVMGSCDDQLLSTARRNSSLIKVRVMGSWNWHRSY